MIYFRNNNRTSNVDFFSLSLANSLVWSTNTAYLGKDFKNNLLIWLIYTKRLFLCYNFVLQKVLDISTSLIHNTFHLFRETWRQTFIVILYYFSLVVSQVEALRTYSENKINHFYFFRIRNLCILTNRFFHKLC